MQHSPPILSVIIPTHRRPQYLPRAINSSLNSAPEGDVEVIVVPNGVDQSWRPIQQQYKNEPRVLWRPITIAHANIARNYGMSLAQGHFIRFLDDDDFLYPAACLSQCKELANGADICSAAVNVISDQGELILCWQQPAVDDIVVAMLGPGRVTHVAAHLFKRDILAGITWDESLSIRQDTDWMIRIATKREVNWVCLNEATGAWVHHEGERLSRGKDPGAAAIQRTAEMIITAVNTLETQGRLSDERRIAASDGLWSCIHKGLKYDYRYWRAIARIANSYAPGRFPPSRIYQFRLIRLIGPVIIETILVPLRWAYRAIGTLQKSLR